MMPGFNGVLAAADWSVPNTWGACATASVTWLVTPVEATGDAAVSATIAGIDVWLTSGAIVPSTIGTTVARLAGAPAADKSCASI